MARILNLGVCVIVIALLSAVLVVPVAATVVGPRINNSLETTPLAPTVVFTAGTDTSQVPSADSDATVHVQVTVTTPGGNADLSGVTAVIASADGQNTATATLTQTASSDAKTTTWDGDLAVPYWWSAGDMQITVTATTVEQLTGTATQSCTYASALGVTVDTPSLDFGAVTYGTTTGDQVATVHNNANTPISSITGTAYDWVSDGTGSTIPASALHLSTPDTPMGTDTTISGVLGVQTTSSLSSANIGFHVVVPGATSDFVLQGNYNSVTRVTAWA